MDADGGGATQLTFDDACKDQVPDWSPDGSKIAYAAGDPGDVLVMNADGSNQHTLVGGPTDDFGSAWSPDGGQIAFVRFDDRTVYVVNADGTDLHARAAVRAAGGPGLAATRQPAAVSGKPLPPGAGRRRSPVHTHPGCVAAT